MSRNSEPMMDDEEMDDMELGDKRDSGTPSASSSLSSSTPTISPEPENDKRSKVSRIGMDILHYLPKY